MVKHILNLNNDQEKAAFELLDFSCFLGKKVNFSQTLLFIESNSRQSFSIESRIHVCFTIKYGIITRVNER